MSTAPEPSPPGARDLTGEPAQEPAGQRGPVHQRPNEPTGSAGGVAEPRSRLRPPPSAAPAHAPLLLGIDAAGGEHHQGPGDVDDQGLVGRCWGCGCGWRGTVRDVATRHFRPQVGDGGGLRRKRLARADRDARPELDTHLAAAARPTPTAPTAPAAAPPSSSDAVGPGPGARPRGRRRLTLPRSTPEADPVSPDEATGAAHTRRDDAPSPAHRPPDEPTEAIAAAPDLAEPDPDPAGGGGGDLGPTEKPGPGAAAAPGTGHDGLAAAAARAQRARAELEAAATALDAAVVAARQQGASWRTIARATGLPHRDAAARWGQQGPGPSL